jgi:hypothetical protein
MFKPASVIAAIPYEYSENGLSFGVRILIVDFHWRTFILVSR